MPVGIRLTGKFYFCERLHPRTRNPLLHSSQSANPKPTYPAGTAFVLRDEQHRKRKWKTLPRHVLNVKAATIQAKLLEAKLLQGAEEPTGSGHH